MKEGKGLLITGILAVLLLAFGWYKLTPKTKSVKATEDAGASSGGGGGSTGGGGVSNQETSDTTPIVQAQLIITTRPMTFTAAPRTTINPLVTALGSVTKPATTLKITGSDKDDEILISMNNVL
ncbi:MAG: hypothetical protein Q8L90_06920 [Bacteroidota bacterium]|nr:hypothetical protein [Bacteroidota bacterium]